MGPYGMPTTGGESPSSAGGASQWMLPALMGLSSLAGSYGNQGAQSSMMLPMMLMMMQKKKPAGPVVGPGSSDPRMYADYSNPAAQAAMQPPSPQGGPAAGQPKPPMRESPYEMMMNRMNQPYPDQYGYAGF